MIHAKTIKPNEFWILRHKDRKVGNIQHDSDGYLVNLDGSVARFKTLSNVTQRIKVVFETDTQSDHGAELAYHVNGFPTTDLAHNAMFDVKRQLPLWTQHDKSKSWLAAGWYKIRQQRQWRVVQCPKLNILDRYEYVGPFRSHSEAVKS